MISPTDNGSRRPDNQPSAAVSVEAPHEARPSSPGDRVELDLGGLGSALQEALHRASLADADIGASLRSLQRPGVLEGLDRVLDLGAGGAAQLPGMLGKMSPEEADGFLRALADLLKHGIVGHEYRWVNGEPQKVFVDVAIGSDLHRAPLVRGKGLDLMG